MSLEEVPGSGNGYVGVKGSYLLGEILIANLLREDEPRISSMELNHL